MTVQQVCGVMVTMTTYGTWLRGDARGWVEDGRTYPANPALEARGANPLMAAFLWGLIISASFCLAGMTATGRWHWRWFMLNVTICVTISLLLGFIFTQAQQRPQMLLEGADPGDPKTALLEKIERQTFRAAKIVNGLLNLSRPGTAGNEKASVDLNAES